jgi:hypothetical protein
MTASHFRTETMKRGFEDSAPRRPRRVRAKMRCQPAADSAGANIYVALDLLAAMGVNRGVRFLDTFGKIIFGTPTSRQLR